MYSEDNLLTEILCSAFLGILPIENEFFIIIAQKSVEVAYIMGNQIFKVDDVVLMRLYNQGKLNTKIK